MVPVVGSVAANARPKKRWRLLHIPWCHKCRTNKHWCAIAFDSSATFNEAA